MIGNNKDQDISVMHVKLPSPIYLRKEILKTAIDDTRLLKYFENIYPLRARKEAYLKRLSNNFNEIGSIIKRLHNVLPEVEETKREVETEIKPEPKKVSKAIKVKTPQKSKIDLELEAIEERLRNIKI